MEIDDDRMWPRCRRSIETIGQRTVSAGECAIDDVADWSAGRTAGVELSHEVARTLGSERLDRRQLHVRQHVQHQSHVRLQANDLAVVALLGAVAAGEPEAKQAAAAALVEDPG